MFPKPNLEIYPKRSLIDEKVSIQVTGLRPHQPVTVSATLQEKKDIFISFGHFTSDSIGGLDLRKHASQGGTYADVDEMGIFWSMEAAPSERKGLRLIKRDVTLPFIVDLCVHDGHLNMDNCLKKQQILTRASLERGYLAPGVTREVIREGRLRGALFIPPGNGPFPAVIDTYGTGGGLTDGRAALLASKGYMTLALALFLHEDLPTEIGDIDVDYYEEAIQWLSSHPLASPIGLGTLSLSKGCEYACMGASYSSKVVASVNINSYPFITYFDVMHKGKRKKGVPTEFSKLEKTDKGYIFRKCHSTRVEDSLIPLHQSEAQFLFVHCTEDQTVDPDLAIKEATRIFKEHGKSNFEFVVYPGAGHVMEPPYSTICMVTYHRLLDDLVLYGGKKVAHAAAQEDCWRRVLQFLEKHLMKKTIKASRL